MADEMPSPSTTDSTPATSSSSAYHDLRRLIPSLASELDGLRTALREHNLWLQRYGHSSSLPSSSSSSATPAPPPASAPAAPAPDPVPATTTTTTPVVNTAAAAAGAEAAGQLPPYSASDVPPYSGGGGERDEVRARREQIVEWLRDGEDVLREYSARFAQLGEELEMPFEDVLGTWVESNTDNALPDYERIEEREELMVGGVGEVPPPYTGTAGKQNPGSGPPL